MPIALRDHLLVCAAPAHRLLLRHECRWRPSRTRGWPEIVIDDRATLADLLGASAERSERARNMTVVLLAPRERRGLGLGYLDDSSIAIRGGQRLCGGRISDRCLRDDRLI